MKLHPLTVPAFVAAYALACSGKPPEPAEAPAAPEMPSASAAPETAAATQAAEAAPSASAAPAPAAPSAAPEASAAPSSAPPEKAKAGSGTASTKAGATESASGYTGDDPCQTKNFHYGQVKAACNSNGRAGAKGVMKGAVQKAKAAGNDIKCTSCHEDMKSFGLKSNAVGDLKKWL